MQTIGNRWALGFVGLGLCALVGNVILSTGFAVAGERMTRSLRKMAFEAMVRERWGSQCSECPASGCCLCSTTFDVEREAAEASPGNHRARTRQTTTLSFCAQPFGSPGPSCRGIDPHCLKLRLMSCHGKKSIHFRCLST